MVKVTFREKQWEIKPGPTARDALKKLGIDPESVLVLVNGTLATDDIVPKDGDQIKLVAVVSGGCQTMFRSRINREHVEIGAPRT